MSKPCAGEGVGRDVETEFLVSNPRMEQVKEIAEQIAAKNVPVLILGESGVGKEVVARHIHSRSDRNDKPFVKVNCAAMPDELLESELFGHERGAFTGATQRRKGYFELAGDGTILLDEIGEMEPSLQAKLLHVLQDHTFHRVGGEALIDMNARVIATTNVKLQEAVQDGSFRQDLFFRLAVITLELPPLRERRAEIPLLLDHFFARYREQYGAPIEEMPAELREALMEHAWPGNVRELQNVVRRYVLLPDQKTLLATLRLHPSSTVGSNGNGNGNGSRVPREALRTGEASLLDIGAHAAERAEKEAVLEILRETNWNRKEAAQRLNVCYKTLLNKLNKWHFDDRDVSAV